MSITFKGDGFGHQISEQGMYSDGVPFVKSFFVEEIIDFAHTVIVRPKSLLEFVTAMFLVDGLSDRGANITDLVLPYIPGARQDRVNLDGDILFTTASVAEMISSRFRTVKVLDPHSNIFGSFIETRFSPCGNRMNLVEYPLEIIASQIPNNYDGIIAADKGGKERAEKFAKAMNLPIFYGEKVRDVSSGRLSGFNVSVPQGNFLVADDICDGGGTFLGLAEKIADCGATADLYVSHGIFSRGTRDLTAAYGKVYTTDSRQDTYEGGIEVIKVVEDMVDYVY